MRKVFDTSDVEVKPAVALAGAATLFSADLAAIRYTTWLQRFPLLFNAVQASVGRFGRFCTPFCLALRARVRLRGAGGVEWWGRLGRGGAGGAGADREKWRGGGARREHVRVASMSRTSFCVFVFALVLRFTLAFAFASRLLWPCCKEPRMK